MSIGWKKKSCVMLVSTVLVSGCANAPSNWCLLYERVPLTVQDVDKLSLGALRAIEINERIADRLCRVQR